jgi:hypothetical protein
LTISGFLERSNGYGTVAFEDVLHNLLVFLEKKVKTAEVTLVRGERMSSTPTPS